MENSVAFVKETEDFYAPKQSARSDVKPRQKKAGGKEKVFLDIDQRSAEPRRGGFEKPGRGDVEDHLVATDRLAKAHGHPKSISRTLLRSRRSVASKSVYLQKRPYSARKGRL